MIESISAAAAAADDGRADGEGGREGDGRTLSGREGPVQ